MTSPVIDPQDPLSNCLDPDHAVERVLLEMAILSRRKRADYAKDNTPLSNFYESAQALDLPGFDALAAVEFNIVQKEARLRALRANGRLNDVANESVEDTLIDRAVYAVLAVAVYRAEQAKRIIV